MQKQFLIKPTLDEILRHRVLLDYYERLPSGQVKAKICEAASAFWEPLCVWKHTQSREETSAKALLCCQKLQMQSLEIQRDFVEQKVSREGTDRSNEGERLALVPKTSNKERGWKFRLKKGSSRLPLLTYLGVEEKSLTISEKYWIPGEAYWGAYAASTLGLSSQEIQAMVQYSLRVLERQQEFLQKRFVERKSCVESVVKETTESTREISSVEPLDKPEIWVNPEVEGICANEGDLDELTSAFENSLNFS